MTTHKQAIIAAFVSGLGLGALVGVVLGIVTTKTDAERCRRACDPAGVLYFEQTQHKQTCDCKE